MRSIRLPSLRLIEVPVSDGSGEYGPVHTVQYGHTGHFGGSPPISFAVDVSGKRRRWRLTAGINTHRSNDDGCATVRLLSPSGALAQRQSWAYRLEHALARLRGL